MSANLPTLYYVYIHIDPQTREILYVGEGSGQRAWMCLGGYSEVRYGHRSPQHARAIQELMKRGFLPCDWVHIIHRGLTKSEARRKEQEVIRKLSPRFNRPMGKKLLKINGAKLNKAVRLRASGLSYREVADQIDVATMTVYRVLNGQTKNIGVHQ